MSDLINQARHQILAARSRIYKVSGATPLQEATLPDGTQVFIKREDLSPINAYKWRGAYNRMAVLDGEERARGVVTASAGNHAQGVALAARELGVKARIFMPVSTPMMKQNAVRRIGGNAVEVILVGDTYDDASGAAKAEARASGKTYIAPYDDIHVIGGQGTIADEIVMSGKGPFDVAYLPIGGGGLAAGVATWLRYYYPDMKIYGVEGVDQACMKAAIEAGKPVHLDYLDVFCDGTAVRQAGDITFPLCRDLLDGIVTVTNEEVCAGIQWLWEQKRCIPEPAGALSVTAMLKDREACRGKRVVTIVCGANMDFSQLAWIARHSRIGEATRKFFRFEIGETHGSLLGLMEGFLRELPISEFQYGKSHATRAWPVIGFDASPEDLADLETRLRSAGIPYEDVTAARNVDVDFRIIKYKADLMPGALFVALDFHERKGALQDFLTLARPLANICYFNYSYTGERVGRALLGLEFKSPDAEAGFREVMRHPEHHAWRSCREVDSAVRKRIL